MAATIVSGILSLCGTFLADPFKQEFGYLWNYDSNVEDVEEKVKMLEDLKDRLEESLERAEHGHEPREIVKNWRTSVNSIIEGAKKFLEDERETEKGCFFGLCSNFILRHQLGKQAKNTTEKIVRLQDQREEFGSDLTIYTASVSPKFKNEGYEAFESRKSTLDEIMEALRNPSFEVIRIWGMGGIGKTMLVKEVAKNAKEYGLFENVVMAVVSETPNIIEIQRQIAEDLGLKFDGVGSEFERAHQLSQRLFDGRNSILVILDNIWENLELKKVGIPPGCKLVLTSRIRNGILDGMNAKTFEIRQLNEDEARDLFQKRAGDFANDTKLKDTVIKVANECANLPLAIVAVAAALKNSKGPHAWEDALQELTRFTPTRIDRIEMEAYRCLKLSYDYWEDKPQARSLLSLCCLLPEDYHISIQDIIKCGMGLGMFQRMATLEEARNKVQTLVDHLKDHCMLLDGNTTGFFRIHAVFRDVGIDISVASKENGILIVTNGDELRRLTTEDLENCRAMSLPSIDSRELPEYDKGLQCPKLQLLLWSSQKKSLEIPDTFFKGMEQLKVLNLTNIVLSSLPSLSSLQTLCLEGCELKNISRIGGLKKLEILSFKGSDIEKLPREIVKLTHLRLLDLSDCFNLKTIPSDVIASLSELEELYMAGKSFAEWEVDGTNASLVELTKLSRLVSLEIRITDAKILPDEFDFGKLKRYRIFVGVDWDCSGGDETSKTLKLKLKASIPQEGKGINMLLGSTEVLYLDELNGTSSVLYSLDREGFPHLKHLHVQRSSEIEYVIKSEEQDPSCKAFPELESLFLSDLSRLTDIYHGQPPNGSFCKLRILKVKGCVCLNKVLTMSVAGSLLQLQEFAVVECHQMEVIVANNEADKITFPQLHSLKLKCLPVLVSFCAKARTNIHSLNYAGEIIPEGEPHIPTPFFNKKVAFQNLKLLNIECCDSLRNLFSPSMANDLVKLRALKIINCQMMKEIVEKEKGVEEEEIDKIVFRLLSYITLQDLPELRSFYPGDHTFECPSLQRLTIDGCPKIKKFTSTYKGLQVNIGEDDLNGPSSPLFDEKVVFPNLEFLMIENFNSLKEIWSSQLPVDDDSFCKLKSLYLHDCEHLLNIFPSHMLMRLQNLTSLLVTTCQNLKHIFTTSIANSLVQLQELKIGNSGKVEEIVEKERVEEELMVRIVFPQLTSLHFWGLPKLNSFGQGIFISDWTSLKTLNVSGSDNVETLALELSRFEQSGGKGHVGTPTKQPLFLVDKVAFPNLEELELSFMSNMKESWIDQFHAASFGKLTVLKIRDCDSLTHLLSLTIAKSLVQIKRIIVENCNMMKEVVASEEGKETNETTFSQLISLQLIKLPNLTSFCERSNTFLFLSLEEVSVEECPKMKTFCNGILKTPKLEKVHTRYRGEVFDEGIWKGDLNTTIQYMFKPKVFLKLSKLSELKQICHNQFPVEACVVTNLVVEKCTSLLNVVPSNMLESLRMLEIITVDSCYSLEQVFDLEGLNYEEKHNGLLSNLEGLYLNMLPKLRCIWNKDPEGILSFRNLRWLSIHKCHSLRNMFSPSMVPYLTGLEQLKITDCLNMEEIIGKEKRTKEEAIDKIEFIDKVAFPNLEELELSFLYNMKEIWQGRFHTPLASKLRSLKVERCQINVLKVSPSPQNLQYLQVLSIRDCPMLQEIFGEEGAKSTDEIVFHQLTSLSLYRLDQLKSFYKATDKMVFPQLTSLSLSDLKSFCQAMDKMVFPKLTSLTLDYLPQLKSLYQGIHVSEYSSLKKLEVSRCRRVQIFASEFGQPLFLVGKVSFPNLEELQLSCLDMMEKIWQGQFHEPSISNLRVLKVEECRRISQVFPISSIQNLQKLEELSVKKCAIVKDIVGEEGEEEETTDKMMLPQLTSLSLSSLGQLKSFCRGIPISKWTSLKKLTLSECNNVRIFAWELNKETGGTPVVPADQPLFLMDKVAFPDLEELELKHLPRMKEIWDGQFHAQSLCKLRVLKVEKCSEISRVFPISLLQDSQNLEVLTVSECSKLKVVFEHGGVFGEVGSAAMFPHLRVLNLNKLPELMHMWKEDSQLSSDFQNLTTLEVSICGSLTHLLPFAMAKSLKQIKSIIVSDCERMKEIITIEEGEATDEITFSQLNSLVLKVLPNLTSFCRGSNTLSFPSLVEVLIEGCPELKTFSDGILNTPKLKRVWQRYHPVWKGDLNTTIQHYFD